MILAVLRKNRVIPRRIIHADLNKSAEQQMVRQSAPYEQTA